MIDANRPVMEQLADGVLDMLSRGYTRNQIIDHLLDTLAPTSPLGPKWGHDVVWWAVRWTMNGRPHVTVDHKLSASLVATEIPPDFADEVVPPWSQFMATMPAGLSRQVRVDAREYVRAYVAGEKRSIKVQYMRRGHWRNQPCGPRSSLRKFIHIEPHWVGPEAAPIAVRSHRMDSKEGA